MEYYNMLLPLAIILIVSKLLAKACTKFNLPTVVGLLVTGLLMSLIRYIPGQTILDATALDGLGFLAKIGVILIMFETGLETDVKQLRDVGVGGERAVTHWKSLKVKDGCTLLRIHLETGRTHQIRVHFKSLGAPLVGDDMYGSTDKRLSHQALHCCFVRFTHPVTEKIMEFTAPMPDDMNKLT